MKSSWKSLIVALASLSFSMAAYAIPQPVGTISNSMCGQASPTITICTAIKVGFQGSFLVSQNLSTGRQQVAPATVTTLVPGSNSVMYSAVLVYANGLQLPTALTLTQDTTGQTVGTLKVLSNNQWQPVPGTYASFRMEYIYHLASPSEAE